MVRNKSELATPVLAPLSESVQRADHVYNALVNGIINGALAPGSQLNADNIAQQLKVSTTPVRDALNRLVEDGIVYKLPYQGWFVCRFEEQEIRDLGEMRAGLECFSIRLACERVTPQELAGLRAIQKTGEAALAKQDLEAYRLYNQELHEGIMRAAKNSQLAAVFGPISLKTQMLMSKTIRAGRWNRAMEEHRRLLRLIAGRDACAAQALMQEHILSAVEDILRHGLG